MIHQPDASLHTPFMRHNAIAPTERASEQLLDTAIDLARHPRIWPKLAAPDATGRSYSLIVRTQHYEAWLIRWMPGALIQLHDHGGSAAALAIIEGNLTERVLEVRTKRRFFTRDLEAQNAIFLPHDHVHEVSNRGTKAAFSVHVYRPRLNTMTFFDHDGAEGLQPSRVEHVNDWRK